LEISLVFDAFEAERKARYDLASWQVWRAAWLARIKPKLLPKKPDELIRKRSPGPAMAWQEQKSIVNMVNQMYGGGDKRKKKG